jgi:AcrR family transcriptional regulator
MRGRRERKFAPLGRSGLQKDEIRYFCYDRYIKHTGLRRRVKHFMYRSIRKVEAMAERGRPRSFERTKALDRAIEVFWARGYAGASISELTAAMGINSPSLYAAFGSKEALFREAVSVYAATATARTLAALEAPSARESIAAMLLAAAEGCVVPGKPSGCLIALGAVNGGPDSDAMQQLLSERRRLTTATIRNRLQRGIADGQLPVGVDVDGVAAYFSAIINGLSIEARDGATIDALRRVVDNAMAGWDALIAPRVLQTKGPREARAGLRHSG